MKVWEVKRPNISKASYVLSSPEGIDREFDTMEVGDVVTVECHEMSQLEIDALPDDFAGW